MNLAASIAISHLLSRRRQTIVHDPAFAQAADRRLFLVDGRLQLPEKHEQASRYR
jgi:hypothetical protein